MVHLQGLSVVFLNLFNQIFNDHQYVYHDTLFYKLYFNRTELSDKIDGQTFSVDSQKQSQHRFEEILTLPLQREDSSLLLKLMLLSL